MKKCKNKNCPDNECDVAELRKLFHKAWGQAYHSITYDKKVWADLQAELERKLKHNI